MDLSSLKSAGTSAVAAVSISPEFEQEMHGSKLEVNLLHFRICFHIKSCIHKSVMNKKHNKPYGIFICFLVQVYNDK